MIMNPMGHQEVTAVGRSNLDTEELVESQFLYFGSK